MTEDRTSHFDDTVLKFFLQLMENLRPDRFRNAVLVDFPGAFRSGYGWDIKRATIPI